MATTKLLQRNLNVVRRSVSAIFQPTLAFAKALPVTSSHISYAKFRYFSLSAYTNGIIKSKYADIQPPTNLSIPQYMMSDFDKYGDRVALIDGLSNRSYTFRQLKDLVYRCGSGLVKAGFKPGDVCALYKPNSPEYFISFNSVLSVGGVITTVNPLYNADELTYQLKICDANWLITVPECVENAVKAVETLPHMKGVYVMGEEGFGGYVSFSKLMEDDGSAFPTDVKVNPTEDVAILPFSSGTTGLPKGVMLTHYNFIANIEQTISPGLLKFESETDVFIAILPLFHLAGLSVILSVGMKQGVKIITLPRFDPETFLRSIQEHKVTRLLVVPPIFVFMAKHPLVDQYDLSSVKDIVCGAASTGPDTIKAVMKRLSKANPSVRQVFGMTELSPLVTGISTHEEFKVGSVGALLPNTEAKVVDVDTGETLGMDQDGELCFRGPQVMKGYLKNIEATKQTVTEDGWLHTGDIGHYDEREHFYVVDRLKELIKFKALQVAPAELEDLILSMPDVQDVAVVGLPDEEAGELPKAFVVPKSDKLKPEDVLMFVEGKVAPHKKLRGGVEFIDEIPKSASGKILRRVLKAK